jgi:hypothetical protein
MADIVYTVNQDYPENIAGFEQYSQEDKNLVSSFQINSVFDPTINYSQLHILSLSDELLESAYDYTSFTQLGNAQSAGQSGASVLTIDPIADSRAYGYENGGVKLLYHFLDDLYTQDRSTVEFYVQNISQDRTELSLSTLNRTPEELVATTSAIKNKLESQSYFAGFRLDFKNNDLFIATNIDTLDVNGEKVVVAKLYEPLPTTYGIKSTLNIVEVVSDSVAYEVDSEFITAPEVVPTLRSANFNIEIADESVIPTQYYNYDELFSYPITNANSEIYSTVNEKGIDISVDYTTFSDFVHFSSAQERLLNFKYKLDLVFNYSASISSIASATTGLGGVSGSRTYYENLMTGVINNFDHYERFLYYESGSSSWPKSNTTKPYINKVSTNPESITWYADQIATAIDYDLTNYSSLVYSIPTYLRDDANNENYLTFVYMVGQHFDNLWLYSKAVTDKYDADNRIDKGISKDLVAEALKNFGVKLYTSNKSTEDLFTTFIGQAYQSGSEKINYYITGSLTGSNTPIQPTSYNNYEKEVQKRIYHNLPLLLKSKGTERGLRALINCMGIPADILDIKLYGGRNVNERPFFGDYQGYTGSLDKVRLDNTGSIVSGNTLSINTSIIKRDQKYTDDLHTIEVGFSPIDNVDNYIKANITSSFNIDQYIGDPRNLYLDNYSGLEQVATTLLSGSLGTTHHYDLQDYVKLIKFFDNTVFKMVKDFIPARAVADTGIIIKPNLLNRAKAKSVELTGTRPEYTASIETGFASGSDGGSFGIENSYNTAYANAIQTPLGIGTRTYHLQQEAKYDGEFLNSEIVVSTRDINLENNYKFDNPTVQNLPITLITTFPENICVIASTYTPIDIVAHIPRNIQVDFTSLGVSGVLFTTNSIDITAQSAAYTFPNTNYTTFQITASNPALVGCSGSITYLTQYCDILTTGINPPAVLEGSTTSYDLTTWFTIGSNTNMSYTATWSTGQQALLNPTEYVFTQTYPDTVVIAAVDNAIGTCSQQVSVDILDRAYECVYLESLTVTKAGAAGPEGEYLPFTYSYILCNSGLGGERVSFTAYPANNEVIAVEQCIVVGSLQQNPNRYASSTYGDSCTI